jgi:hypothetical protein
MSPNLLPNGFEVELSSHAFTTQVRNMKTSKGLRRLREEHEGSRFLYWSGRAVFTNPPEGLPRTLSLGAGAYIRVLFSQQARRRRYRKSVALLIRDSSPSGNITVTQPARKEQR